MKGQASFHKSPGAKWWCDIWYRVENARSLERILWRWPLTLGTMKRASAHSDKYALADCAKEVDSATKGVPDDKILCSMGGR